MKNIIYPKSIPSGYRLLKTDEIIEPADLVYMQGTSHDATDATDKNYWSLTNYPGYAVGSSGTGSGAYIRKVAVTNAAVKNDWENVEYKIESLAKLTAVIAHLRSLGYNNNAFAYGKQFEAEDYIKGNWNYLQIGAGGANVNHFGANINNKWPLVTFEQVFELPPAKKPFVPVKVELNDAYTAEIQKNGDIKVGCQTFTYAKLQELLVRVKNVVDTK